MLLSVFLYTNHINDIGTKVAHDINMYISIQIYISIIVFLKYYLIENCNIYKLSVLDIASKTR